VPIGASRSLSVKGVLQLYFSVICMLTVSAGRGRGEGGVQHEWRGVWAAAGGGGRDWSAGEGGEGAEAEDEEGSRQERAQDKDETTQRHARGPGSRRLRGMWFVRIYFGFEFYLLQLNYFILFLLIVSFHPGW